MTDDIQNNTQALVDSSRFEITNGPTFMQAGIVLKNLRESRKKVEDFFADSKAKAFAAHKAVVASEKTFLEPLKEAESSVIDRMTKYALAHATEPEEASMTLKQMNVHQRVGYSAKVTDLKVLLQAVLDGKAPEHLISVDAKALNSMATAMGPSLKMPGIEVQEKTTWYYKEI